MLFQKFNDNTGILSVKARGNIDFFEVIDLHTSIQNNDELPRKLKIFIDIKQSKFDFEIKYYDAISEAIENLIVKYDIIKEAMIVDTSYETDIVLMFDDKTLFDNYSFKVFKTEDAAKKWLDF